jgi:hypothetical protein
VANWAASRPEGSSPEEALAWLQTQAGLTDKLIEAILPVLQGLWTDAWGVGWEAAAEVSGIQSELSKQQIAGYLANFGAAWAGQIAATTLSLLASVLAAGGTVAAATLASSAAAVLTDPQRASSIALTEVTRASSEAAAAFYRARGINRVRWLTEPGACAECKANEIASSPAKSPGGWPAGVPFPSGATAPPQHPNCRCALVPA